MDTCRRSPATKLAFADLRKLISGRTLTCILQERRKIEEVYVQGLQKLARRPQQDGAAALGWVDIQGKQDSADKVAASSKRHGSASSPERKT